MEDEKPQGNRRTSRLNRKLRGRIAGYLVQIDIDRSFPQDLIGGLLDALAESVPSKKLQAAGQDVMSLISSEFRVVVGEERCLRWRQNLMIELADKMQETASKMHACNSQKRRLEFSEKFFARNQRLMDYCLFLGVEWEEIQDLLDETINNEY